MSIDVDTEIARLYSVPLSEFVNARNQLSARLRGTDRALAAQVKKLAKPSISAWAVNQAYWHDRDTFNALLDAGEDLRAIQTRVLAGQRPDGWHAAMQAQRSALTAVMAHATRALTQAGHGTNNAVLRRVATTLEALAAYGRADQAPVPGRLIADVPAPGFDALTALAPASGSQASGSPASRPRSSRSGSQAASANDNTPAAERARQAALRMAEQARGQARAAVAAARADLDARQRTLAAAARAEKAALDQVYAAEKAVAAAEQELARVVKARDRAVDHAEHAKREVEEAGTDVSVAEAKLQRATDSLARLEGASPGPAR